MSNSRVPIPRPGTRWGRLECLQIMRRPVMLPMYGGGEYHSGEYEEYAVELRCDCGTVLEFPLDKWPGKQVLKMCPACKTDQTESRAVRFSGSEQSRLGFPRRLEANSVLQLYLPQSWRTAIDEIYRAEANRDSKNLIFENRIRKLFDMAARYAMLIEDDAEIDKFMSDPLFAALERGRLKQTQALLEKRLDSNHDSGKEPDKL